MRRILALGCGLLSMLGLNACDPIHIQELQPGVSTAAEVRDRFGVPGMEWRNEDGSVSWEYTRQPQGTDCYMITIGPDQVLRSIEQVLNENTFARIKEGMNESEIRRALGKPGYVRSYALSDETVWLWRIESEPSFAGSRFFAVRFDTAGRVVGTDRTVEHEGG